MVGPSDSFTHSIHKLSEASRDAIRGLQTMDIPPAYSANPAVEDEDSDDESDVDRWTRTPVIVHIDASISIEGTGNQIALPPHPVASPLRVAGEGVRAAQGSSLDFLPTSSLADAQDATPQRLTRDRATQISDAVLQALTTSGIFAGTVTPQRQLEVHVDASISVKGERNIITTNVPIRRVVSANAQGETPSPLRSVLGQNSRPNTAEIATGDIVSSLSQVPTLVGRTLETEEEDNANRGVPETLNAKRKSVPSLNDDEDRENEEKLKRAKI
jgi:hypothetical protein